MLQKVMLTKINCNGSCEVKDLENVHFDDTKEKLWGNIDVEEDMDPWDYTDSNMLAGRLH